MFEDFEGFKKIENVKKLSIEKIYSILADYQNEMGKMEYDINMGDKNIIIDFKGKYNAQIKAYENEIIIERVLEEGKVEDREPTKEKGKKIKMAQADRMIDQIYDLIKDYMDDEIIEEPITSSKKTLRMQLKEKISILWFNLVRIGDRFEVTDLNNTYVFEVEDNRINKTYSIKNVENHMEVGSVNYSKLKLKKFTIIEKPFQITELTIDSNSEKLRFIPTGTGQNLKISGDYTDNHFIVELDEVVIGAIDSLDPEIKNDYRIEINDLKKENLLIGIAVVLHIYGKEELKKLRKQQSKSLIGKKTKRLN